MINEKVNTIKYPASVDEKFRGIALALGLSKRELFAKMVDYFHRTKKDPGDINDELLKNSLSKSHKAYTSFIKAQENLLLIPMKESMDRMIANQKEVVKYFNEQVLNANKAILRKLEEQGARLQHTENLLLKNLTDRETLKTNCLHILNSYIVKREEMGHFKTREKEGLAELAREQIKKI